MSGGQAALANRSVSLLMSLTNGLISSQPVQHRVGSAALDISDLIG